MIRFNSTLAAALLLAACSPSRDAAGNDAERIDAPPGDNAQAALPAALATPPSALPGKAGDGETVGGDGSAIILATLTGREIEAAALSGELACSFGTVEATPLLLARGNVKSAERAQGVVKILDSVEPISAPGGYDGMIEGATFAGKGQVIRIAVTGPALGGGESPPHSATLTYQRADGASRSFAGLWTCGP